MRLLGPTQYADQHTLAMKSLTSKAIVLCLRGLVKVFRNPPLPRNRVSIFLIGPPWTVRQGPCVGRTRDITTGPRLNNTGGQIRVVEER